MNGPRNRFGLGKRGPYPGQIPPSNGPTGTDPYRQYPANFRGGVGVRSGPKGPKGQTVHAEQFGPVDIRQFNCEYEAMIFGTPNVRNGQFLISVNDRFDDQTGGYIFATLAAQITVYGWNSGTKQAVKRQQVRSSTGPLRWIWDQGEQFDQISVGVLPFILGSTPTLPGLNPGVDVVQALEVSGVFRYMTTEPTAPQEDNVNRG